MCNMWKNDRRTQNSDSTAETDKMLDKATKRNGSKVRKSKGYVFRSPWDGECTFETGARGRSLKVCQLSHHNHAAFSSLTVNSVHTYYPRTRTCQRQRTLFQLVYLIRSHVSFCLHNRNTSPKDRYKAPVIFVRPTSAQAPGSEIGNSRSGR